jgi:aconitate decarboxylase
VIAGLGEQWEVERMVIKRYAAMGGIHSPLDALFDAARERPLRAEEIEKIQVNVTHATYHHGWWRPERPLTPIGAQMNIGYALAAAVLDGAAMVKQFTPSRINRDDVWAMLERIDVRHEPEFDAGGQKGRGRTRLVIAFKDGSGSKSTGRPRARSNRRDRTSGSPPSTANSQPACSMRTGRDPSNSLFGHSSSKTM